MARTLPGSVKARFEAIIRESIAPLLIQHGFADVTKERRKQLRGGMAAIACLFERRFGDVWQEIDVQRDKYLTSDHYKFTLNAHVHVRGFTELMQPRANGTYLVPVLQGRPAMLTRSEDTWWELREPGPLTLSRDRSRDNADAIVAADMCKVIERDALAVLNGLTAIDVLVSVIEHPPPPPPDIARAFMLIPLSVTTAAVLCALTNRHQDRDRLIALARERAHLGPVQFPDYLDSLESRLGGTHPPRSSDPAEPPCQLEVSQHELNLWQVLARCVAYATFTAFDNKPAPAHR